MQEPESMNPFRPLVVAGPIALVAGLALSAAVAQQPVSPQPAITPQPAMPGAPTPPPVAPVMTNALKFEMDKFDFGDIADTEPVSQPIKFTNATSETIKIAVAASCGCTAAGLEKNTFAPGESGTVTAQFNPHGRAGPQTKTLTFTVIEPAGKYAQQTFSLTSNVKALVTFDPPKMYLSEVDHRKGQSARLTLTGRKADFKVLSVTPSSEFVTAKILDAEPAEVNGEKLVRVPIELEIGKNAPIGNFSANLDIKVNDEKAKINPYFVGADVIGDVKATPPQAILRTNTPATRFDTRIRLDSRSGSAFNVSSIDVEKPADMQVTTDIVRNDEGKSYEVTISGTTPNRGGMVQGFLVVTSEAQGGVETMRIPFTAVIQAPAQAPVPVAVPPKQ
jgi:predicted RNA-binding protein with TRAM domain